MCYRDTCPKRTIVKVHHTVKTWLPITLDCGHVEEINWTAHEGSKIGCTKCMNQIEMLATTPSASRYDPFRALQEIAKIAQHGNRG